jgi:diguanylate cyclase (GGDEF)-like protein/PAS domain S-box-containing protein
LPASDVLISHFLENATIGIAIADPDGRIVRAGAAFGVALGYEPDACLALRLEDVVVGEATEEVRDQVRRLKGGDIDVWRSEQLCRRKDGTTFCGRLSVSTVNDDGSACLRYLVVLLEDIDRQKRAEADSALNESRMNYALESAGQGVWDYDFNAGEMFYSNMWRQMRGIGLDEAVDSSQEAWLSRMHPDDRDRIREIVRQQDAGEIERNAFEYRERHRDGHWMWVLSRGKMVAWNPDGSPARVIGTDTDITRLKEDEARLAAETEKTYLDNMAKLQEAHQAVEAAQQVADALARHDALTGLPNRRVFAEVLDKAIATTLRSGRPHALLSIDLDRFKPVNDIYGHATGDAVLCEIANRLRAVVRDTDTIARLGGDEFAIILDSAAGEKTPGGDAIRLAKRVIEAVQRPILYDNHKIEIGASIGIAVCPADGRDADTIFHAADMAMYRAKQEARGTFRFFERSMEADLRARASLEDDVRQAVAAGAIEPHYQPLIRLAENRLSGFEVLARWRHAERGDVPPEVFIPVIERLGLIAEFTYTLLRRACLEARKWPPEISIAVNISPFHLDDPLLPVKVLAILSETGFPPDRLEIEVTESAVTQNLEAAQRSIKTLQSLGIRISLDDFGTGYSNLSNLRAFRFDKIKIDRSFVQSMEVDSGNAQLVHSILDLARNLGLPTVAEGIEHVEALRQILAGGGEFGQGFYFGKAMPAAEADALLRRMEAEARVREPQSGAA